MHFDIHIKNTYACIYFPFLGHVVSLGRCVAFNRTVMGYSEEEVKSLRIIDLKVTGDTRALQDDTCFFLLESIIKDGHQTSYKEHSLVGIDMYEWGYFL